VIDLLNGLDTGSVKADTTTRVIHKGNSQERSVWDQVHRYLLSEVAKLHRVRRSHTDLSGVQALSELLKTIPIDEYSVQRKKGSHILIPHAVDEPSDDGFVYMLDALSPEESLYYSEECQVVNYHGKSQIIFNELEDRFAFVGGTEEDYVTYFMRPDLPKGMWFFDVVSQAKAVAGFTIVPKKDPAKQRKLLMACSANYMMHDVKQRSEHGLLGGEALGSLHVPSDFLNVSSFDESNAFSYIKITRWLSMWMAAPPIRAIHVWSLLTDELKSTIGPMHYVCPFYTRLPMGFAHAVHILMDINITSIGKTLLNWGASLLASQSCKLSRVQDALAAAASLGSSTDITAGDILSDEAWDERQQQRRFSHDPNQSTESDTLQQWIQRVREAKRSTARVFVGMHLFAGSRRKGDLEHHLQQLALSVGIALLFI